MSELGDATRPPAGRQAGVPFILIAVFLDVMTFGLAIPVLPEIIKSFSAGDAAAASRWMGILVASFALAQFVFAPILGAVSDRFGRRPVILLSLLGAALDHLLLAFAPNLLWVFVGRVLAGLTAANITAANAYIADVSAPERRARNFGLIGATFGIGFIAGPLIGGFLGEIDLRLPFFAAAGLAALNFLYGLVVLPESLRPENRRAFSWRRANPLGSIRALRVNRTVLGLAGTMVCVTLAFGVLQTVWVLYTGERYGWSSFDNGLSLTVVGLAMAVVQGGLVGPVVRRFGDRGAALGGLAVSGLGYVAYGLAPNGGAFYAAILLGSLGGVAGPAIQGLITKNVGADEQGSVQGAFASLNSLMLIVAPLLGGGLFSAFVGADAIAEFPGMPFFFGAVAMFAGVLLARRALARPPVPAVPDRAAV